MKGWRRKGDWLVAAVDAAEASVLRDLVSQVLELLRQRDDEAPTDELAELTGIRTGPATAPEDPVLHRLLPDFHRLDGEAGDLVGDDDAANADSAAALRSLHEPALLASKTSAANVVLATCPERGGKVSLDPDQASAWLSALNDVRLSLGTRLGVTEDMPEQLPPEDPRARHLVVYHWVTWCQDSLVQAVMR
ncbi:MAG: DUF2017 domain-containing protein [Sciscionella sp.]|nr:DUF2017 domain-containing protein [Sciscionella sp.]